MKSNCARIKNAATVVGEVKSMCVVPVRLRHFNSQKEVKAFASLDSCNQGTFVTERILKELDVTGVKTSINIKTLNGNQKVFSTLVDGIMVSKQVVSTRDQIHWVKRPKLYARNEIPADPSEVATPLTLKKWRYLDCIAGKIDSDDAVSIDVLIGANCTRVLEPIDFIASKDGGPYALETVLGWCFVGPIGRSCKGDDIIGCSRIAVQDPGTKQISRHHFEIQKAVKDTEISDMMQRMYHLDFIEPRIKFKGLMTNKLDEISYEDKKFFKIMEDQVVKVGKHYVNPSPLRNPEMTLPNNRVMAEKRAHYLKRKFRKDELYFSYYKDFMNEIIEKGYARVSARTPADGNL